MKKTMNKAQNKASKNGLSLMLTLVLLLNVGQPMVVKAESPSETTLAIVDGKARILSEDEVISEDGTTVEKKPETVQNVLLEVCKERGYGEDCAKHLLGMLWKESNNHADAIGDHGKARGYFQIWYKLHKISIACAEDLRCSANWTLDYLEGNAYPRYVSYAIQCHNGCNIANGYAASALRYGRYFWNQPLEVKTADEERAEKVKLALR